MPMRALRATTMPPPPAELRNVFKHYRAPGWRATGRRLHALSNVSLTVGAGEWIGLQGPNRSGKTTLLRLLLGLSRPTFGSCWRFGRPASDSGTLAPVGYVPDRPTFPPELSPGKILRRLGALSGLSPTAIPVKVDHALAEAELDTVAHRPLGTLSRGTQQRLAIAQAFLHGPTLLLLDEPFNALDTQGAAWLSRKLASWADAGCAAVLVSHDPAPFHHLATRIVQLQDGHLLGSDERPPVETHTETGIDTDTDTARNALREVGA